MTDGFAAIVRDSGADFRSLGSFNVDDKVDELLGARRHTQGVSISTGVTVLLRLVARMLKATPQIRDRVLSERPDLIVYDTFALWGHVLASSLDIPAVSLSTTYAASPHSVLSRQMRSGLAYQHWE
ncbi:MAG: hypothetical protein ACOH2F_14810 [Cellulomonas sp.]